MKTRTKCLVAVVLGACVLLAVGSFGTHADSSASAPWYDVSWAKRQPLTIDHNQVAGDLADFPVLLTEANVQPSLFAHAKSDGSDIVVTAGDGVTKLKRELVGFDNVANTMELYVKVPFLSSSADTLLYLYYDNPSASLANDDDTWDSGYVMVQHMEDASPSTILGSTGNHYVGTKGDVPHTNPTYRVNPSVEVDGKIGRAQAFDMSWIDVGVHADFNLRQHFTVEVWAFPVTPDEQYNGAVVSHDMLSTGRQWDAPILMDGWPPQVTLQVRKSGDRRVHAGLPNYDHWNHIAAVYNDTDPKLLFLNGVKNSQPGDGLLDDAPSTPLVIGTHYKFNWENHPSFLGVIDEVRISNVARSDEWIATGRNYQLDPSAFSSAGDEESLLVIVDLDIKPGGDPNAINCQNEKGVIPVAILTSDDFDATTVDHTTVTFAGASETHVDKKTGEPRRHEEDVDGDEDIDLVFHFRFGDTDLTCDSTEGTLVGQTFDGQPIAGTDTVHMVHRMLGGP